MLHIYLGIYGEDLIKNVDYYFNGFKKKEWFNDPVVKDIILKIDKSIAVKDEYIESPVFGGMSPDRLSSGCKAVILMWVLDNVPIYGTRCGDNCAQVIYDLSKKKDITMVLAHPMKLPDDVHAIMEDSGKEITSGKEYILEYYRIKDSRNIRKYWNPSAKKGDYS